MYFFNVLKSKTIHLNGLLQHIYLLFMFLTKKLNFVVSLPDSSTPPFMKINHIPEYFWSLMFLFYNCIHLYW